VLDLPTTRVWKSCHMMREMLLFFSGSTRSEQKEHFRSCIFDPDRDTNCTWHKEQQKKFVRQSVWIILKRLTSKSALVSWSFGTGRWFQCLCGMADQI
jgi:hypothetical protein